jgi:hypothetical protein
MMKLKFTSIVAGITLFIVIVEILIGWGSIVYFTYKSYE